ncbi:MAG: hypothetical protein LBO63_03595 [Oscillospiraceae bacterium]|jgi:hypothetical protein|nr:hypothetical protein [Oscillospiraceae bacterium]
MSKDKLTAQTEKTLLAAKKFSPSNKSFFSKGIYFEGLRQGKVVGFIYAGIMALLSIVIVFGSAVVQVLSEDLMLTSLSPEDGLGIVTYMSFFLIIPALMFLLFHFLSTRKGSDHFYSLPVTRSAILVSYTLSAFTWVVIGLLVFLLPILAINIFAVGSVYLAGWLALMASVIVACMLTAAAMLIAVSVASNLFGQVAVTLLVLFLPRVLITFGYFLAAGYTEILFPLYNSSGFLNPSTNILTGIVFAPFGLGVFTIMPRLSSVLYTIGLSAVYFAIALVLFRRRPSEAAEEPASSGLAQNIISALVAFVVALIPIVLLIELATEKRNHGSYDVGFIIAIAALYGLSLIVFFAYRAISAKSLSAVRRPWSGLAIFLALNIAFLGIWSLAVSATYGFNPTAQSITYFKADIGRTVNQAFGIQSNQYAEYLLSQYEIEDEVIDEQIVTALRRNVQDSKEGTIYENPQNSNGLQVTMKIGARTVNRKVLFSDEEYAIIIDRLKNNHPKILELARSFPEPEEASHIQSNIITNEKEVLELARSLFAELQEQGRSSSSSVNSVYVEPLDSLWLTIPLNGMTYWMSDLFINETTPKTAELLLSYLEKRNPGSLDELILKLEASKYGRMAMYPIIAGRDNELTQHMEKYGTDWITAELGTYYESRDYEYLSSDYMTSELALELARENWGRVPELGKSILSVNYEADGKNVVLLFGLDENGAAFRKYKQAVLEWREQEAQQRIDVEYGYYG